MPATTIRAMLRVRMFIACLLLLALPLQGMAAVLMQTCAPAAHANVAAAHPAGLAGMHAQRGHLHAGSSMAQPCDSPAPHDGGTASLHHCAFCAASCHSMAVALAAAPFDWQAPPLAADPRTSERVKEIFLALPDKPPRA